MNAKTAKAKAAVQEEISEMLRRADRQIAAYTEKMNNDYAHFFEWNADKMLGQQIRRKFYANLAESLADWDGDDLSAELLGMAQRMSNEIVRGSLTRNSTSQMANLSHLIDLQTKQELIREVEGMAHIAQYFAQ